MLRGTLEDLGCSFSAEKHIPHWVGYGVHLFEDVRATYHCTCIAASSPA